MSLKRLFFISVFLCSSLASFAQSPSTDAAPLTQQSFLENYREAVYNLYLPEQREALLNQLTQLPELERVTMRALLAYSEFALNFDGKTDAPREQAFRETAEDASVKLQEHLDRTPDDLSAKLNLGVVYGLWAGVALSHEQSYLKAYRYGNRGVALLDEVYEQDPNLHDVQLSSGVLKLMIAQSAWYVRWVAPMVLDSGSIDAGVEHLNTVLRKGRYVQDEALLAHVLLLWGDVPPKQLRASVQALLQFVRRYPDNLQLYVVLARGYWLLGEYDVANYYALQGLRQLQQHRGAFVREHGIEMQSFLLYWHYRYLADQKEWVRMLRQTQQQPEEGIQATFRAVALWNMGQYDKAREVATTALQGLETKKVAMPLFMVPFLFELTPSLENILRNEILQQS